MFGKGVFFHQHFLVMSLEGLSFKYLGATITATGHGGADIKALIDLAHHFAC